MTGWSLFLEHLTSFMPTKLLVPPWRLPKEHSHLHALWTEAFSTTPEWQPKKNDGAALRA